MTKDEMLTLIIEKFGFEHKYTIQFAAAMDLLDTIELEALLLETLNLPLDEFED